MLGAFSDLCASPAHALDAAFFQVPFTHRQHIMQSGAAAVAGCPQSADGALDSVSVPVDRDPVALRIHIADGGVAPPGGQVFRIQADDPTIVAAGDPKQAFAPVVSIPEGGTETDLFSIFGISVGHTTLRAVVLAGDANGPLPLPAGAWNVDEPLDAAGYLHVPATSCIGFDGQPSSDPSLLSTCGRRGTKGAVTDGASLLLLRLRSGLSGTGCFEVTSISSAPRGSIRDGDAIKTTDVEVNGEYQSYSFYRAPDEFASGNVNDATRQEQIEVTFTPSIGITTTTSLDLDINLIRPPVTLIHGLWSKGEDWGSAWKQDQDYHTTYVANYGQSKDNEGTDASNFAINAPKVREFVHQAIETSRKKGFATTKSDVIAHSMGGLITRLYMQGPDFARPDNLFAGDIRKLVTLDSPHWGSNLANMLIHLDAVHPVQTPFLLGGLGRPIDRGAICDLAENSAQLASLGPISSPVLAVAGNGGDHGTPDRPAGFGPTIDEVLSWSYSFWEYFPFYFKEDNDQIVGVSSQVGGGTSLTRGHIHTDAPHDDNLANDVLPRLDETFHFGAIPAAVSDGLGGTRTVGGLGLMQDRADYASQCRPGGPMNPGPTPAMTRERGLVIPDARVQIGSPAPSQEFRPGDSLNVAVTVDPSISVARVIVVSGVGAGAADTPPYQVALTIPSDFGGPLDLAPAVIDKDGNFIAGVSVVVVVRPSAAPLALDVPGYLPLSMPRPAGFVDSLVVVGKFPGGSSVPLRASLTGTAYSSSDPNVVRVDSEGVLNAVGDGSATVTIENQGVKAFTLVEVRSPDAPPPTPVRVTPRLNPQPGGMRLNRNTGTFVQAVSIANPGPDAVLGPLWLTVSGLPTDVTLTNAQWKSQDIAPPGVPVREVTLAGELALRPGDSAAVTLQFLNQNRERISYAADVFQAEAP